MLPAGAYTLSRAGASEDANGTGDLDIEGDLTLHGAGALTTEIDGGRLDRVVDVLPDSDHTFVDGVTVTGGRTPDGRDGFIDGGGGEVAPTPGGAGGGIRVRGPLALTDAVVVTNGTGFGGAEVLDPDGPCDQSTPSANGGDGGGIAVENSELLVSRSTIRGNITGTGGHPSVANECAIAGNSGSGGGISNDGGTVLVEASTIAGNQTGSGGETVLGGGTNGTNGPGGGINNHSGAVELTNTTIFGNVTGGAPARVDTSNTPAVGGGGIAAQELGSTILNHVTLAQNGVGSGLESGIYPAGWEVSIEAGGSARNTLIVNTRHPGLSETCHGLGSVGHTLSFTPVPPAPFLQGCPGATSIDPGLGPLQDNGGPTQTMAIASGSPAVDAVPSTGAQCLATDQRGVRRPEGAGCDIGAFEAIALRQTSPGGGLGLDSAAFPTRNGGRKLTLNGRNVPVWLSCAALDSCEGAIVLRRLGSKGNSQPGYRRAARGRALGSAAYTIDAGEIAKIRVKLTHSAARRVRREGKIDARLQLIETPSGASSEQRVRIRARRP